MKKFLYQSLLAVLLFLHCVDIFADFPSLGKRIYLIDENQTSIISIGKESERTGKIFLRDPIWEVGNRELSVSSSVEQQKKDHIPSPSIRDSSSSFSLKGITVHGRLIKPRVAFTKKAYEGHKLFEEREQLNYTVEISNTARKLDINL